MTTGDKIYYGCGLARLPCGPLIQTIFLRPWSQNSKRRMIMTSLTLYSKQETHKSVTAMSWLSRLMEREFHHMLSKSLSTDLSTHNTHTSRLRVDTGPSNWGTEDSRPPDRSYNTLHDIMYVCLCVCMYVCLCMYVCMCVRMYVCVYVCMYMLVYIPHWKPRPQRPLV